MEIWAKTSLRHSLTSEHQTVMRVSMLLSTYHVLGFLFKTILCRLTFNPGHTWMNVFVCVCVCVCVCVVHDQPCSTLLYPIDCSSPGSSVYGVSQARILKWVAISSSRGPSWSRDRTCVSCVSCIDRKALYHYSTWEVQLDEWGAIITPCPKMRKPYHWLIQGLAWGSLASKCQHWIFL